MDATGNEVVGIIGALATAIFTPMFGVITLWINNKFNAKVLDLENRLRACEERHAAKDAQVSVPKPEAPKGIDK